MKKLIALITLLILSACSSGDDRTQVSDPGWENIGTLQQPLLRRTFDVTPANDTYDFNNATQLNQEGWIGPFLVGITGWVTTSDATAGALIFQMSYEDPTSTSRLVDFGGADPILLLNDSTSFFATQATWMLRNTGFSAWDLNVTLAGSAGTSVVHYEVLVAPTEQSDWTFFSDQP